MAGGRVLRHIHPNDPKQPYSVVVHDGDWIVQEVRVGISKRKYPVLVLKEAEFRDLYEERGTLKTEDFLRAKIELLEEILRDDRCPDCKGRPYRMGGALICSLCNGTGKHCTLTLYRKDLPILPVTKETRAEDDGQYDDLAEDISKNV